MRRPYIAGNWKMNLDRRSARDLAGTVREHAESRPGVDVALFPPAVYLDEVARTLAGSRVKTGAQNACDEESGAFTGEISVSMIQDVGAGLVLLGHSERRHVYGETDELVNRKVRLALKAGLEVMLCVGETLEEREAGSTESVVSAQLTRGLAGVSPQDSGAGLTIAYEPVWAIGTGHTATPGQAGEVHAYLRGVFAGLYSDAGANALRILYGGSVKPDNASELMAVPDIDGALVGGASLKPESFLPIISFDQ